MGKVLCVGRVGNASESEVKESNALGVVKSNSTEEKEQELLSIDHDYALVSHAISCNYALKVSDGLKNYAMSNG